MEGNIFNECISGKVKQFLINISEFIHKNCVHLAQIKFFAFVPVVGRTFPCLKTQGGSVKEGWGSQAGYIATS